MMASEPVIGRRARAVSPAIVPALMALAAAAAFAPPRLKLIGLSPAVIGVVAGLIVVRLLDRPDGPRRRTILAVTAVLVPLTLAGYAVGSFAVWRHAKAEQVAANLMAQPGGKQVLERVRSDEPAANEVEAEFLNAYRERMKSQPEEYLADRLRGLPFETSRDVAIAVASVEFVFACLAGIGPAIFLLRREVIGIEPKETQE